VHDFGGAAFWVHELWAGMSGRSGRMELAGLEADVIAVRAAAMRAAIFPRCFPCSDNIARVVLADCVGTGTRRAWWAAHSKLLHKFHDIRDTAGLLAALKR